MKWNKTPIDPASVRDLADKYGIDLLAAAVLTRRGLTEPDDLRFFFENDTRFLHNPFLLDEMGDAVERIFQAVSEGEKVHVFGDRDVDGVTSTVLMTDTLRNLGLEVSWGVPMGDASYGLTTDLYDGLVEVHTTLLVAVDCGTTNVDEIAYGMDLGVDTIVVDHHNPQDTRPPAVAIVNPKLPDSGYPFDGLCACGLVSKVRYALGFARSDLYNQTVCLLNVRPGNDSVILDVIKMENLIVVDRLTENLVPGVINIEQSRLADFLLGHQILVYEAENQERLLREAFGNAVDIHLIDVAPEFWKHFPSLKGKSLVRLKSQSRLARYGDRDPSEIDVFASLFETFVERSEEDLRSDYATTLDLVAVATLADMMPLRDENRILVNQGLRILSESPRGALRELLDRQKLLGKKLNARDIGWNVSPVINAAGRMGEPDKAVSLFLSGTDSDRSHAADAIMELNGRRRQNGDAGWDLVIGPAHDSLEKFGGRFIFVSGTGIHRGVTGILAGRLARHFKTPAAVVTLLEERAVGSLRSARGLVATELLAGCDDILSDWGGHDAAAGFHLNASDLETLEGRIRDIVPTLEMDAAEEEILSIDAELPRSRFEPGLSDMVDLLGPYGQEFPPVTFLARSVKLGGMKVIGKKDEHLRLEVESGRFKWPAVFWGGVERVGGQFHDGDIVDAVFNLGTNFFQGRETRQLTILDLAVPGTALNE